MKHDWCSRISDRLTSTDIHDFDHIGKTLTAMIPLADACRINFVSLLPILDKLTDVYTKENLNEDSIHIDILSDIQNLRTNLMQISSSDL